MPPFLAWSAVHPVALGQLLDWATRLSLLGGVSGAADVRRALRTDPRSANLHHATIQLEVGALARAIGATPQFEVARRHRRSPMDVVVTAPTAVLAVEAKALLLDADWQASITAHDDLAARVLSIEAATGVACDVRVTASSATGTDEFLAVLRVAAHETAATGAVTTVSTPCATATVSPRDGDSRVRGPLLAGDALVRLTSAVGRKARQHAGEPVWLRIDALNGLWQFTAWAHQPLTEKVASVAAAVSGVLRETKVLGVVLTSGCLHDQAGLPNESVVRRDGCIALRRLVPPLRVRETLVIPADRAANDGAAVWRELYAAEPGWLDVALSECGQPTLAAILEPLGRRSVSRRRSAGGGARG